MKNDNPTPHGQAFPPLRSEDSPSSTPPQADMLEEMQLLWDRQSQRLDQLLDEHPEGLTRGLGRGYPLSRRRRLMGQNLLILLLGLVCGSLGLVRFLAEPTLFYHLLAYLMGALGSTFPSVRYSGGCTSSATPHGSLHPACHFRVAMLNPCIITLPVRLASNPQMPKAPLLEGFSLCCPPSHKQPCSRSCCFWH